MAPSLQIAGIEVIDQTVNASIRLAAGGASATQALDFGEGVPDQATISSVYLDGDTVVGRRTGNRQMAFPLNVYGVPETALTSVIDALRRAVAVDTFTVQWTPDGGQPVVFDAFRATVTRVRNPNGDAAGIARLLITCPALPFGRSTDVKSVTVAATSTQLDAFDSSTGLSGATVQTTTKYEGTGAGQVSMVSAGHLGSYPGPSVYQASGNVTRSLGSVNMATATAVSIRVRWSPPKYTVNGGAAQNWTTNLTATLTLTSAAGSATLTATASVTTGSTSWLLFTFSLASIGSLNLAAVTSYSLKLASDYWGNPFQSSSTYAFTTSPSTAYVDDLRWVPPSSALASTTHGANLLIPAVVGSARTPVNLALANSAATAFGAFLLHAPPDDQDPDVAILSSLSNASTDQTVTIASANANFDGTYSVVLGVATVGGGAVTATVTITQLENGTAVGSATVLASTYTSGPHLVPVGQVTLPLYATPLDNTTTSYTVRVQITGADRYTELMLLDTAGQTIYTDTDLPTARAVVYVDEPTALQSGPNVYATATDRTAAFGILGNCVLSGGPIVFDPGNNKLLAWTSVSAPSLTSTYYPRWLDERVS